MPGSQHLLWQITNYVGHVSSLLTTDVPVSVKTDHLLDLVRVPVWQCCVCAFSKAYPLDYWITGPMLQDHAHLDTWINILHLLDNHTQNSMIWIMKPCVSEWKMVLACVTYGWSPVDTLWCMCVCERIQWNQSESRHVDYHFSGWRYARIKGIMNAAFLWITWDYPSNTAGLQWTTFGWICPQ